MSATTAHPDPQQPADARHEADVRRALPLVVVLALVGVLVASVSVIVWILLGWFGGMGQASTYPLNTFKPGPAENWMNPSVDLSETHRREDAHLFHYEWVDRKASIVRIPIDRAMTLVAERAETTPGTEPTKVATSQETMANE